MVTFAGTCTRSLKSYHLNGKWSTLGYVNTKICHVKRIPVPLYAGGKGVQMFTEKLNQKFLEFGGLLSLNP